MPRKSKGRNSGNSGIKQRFSQTGHSSNSTNSSNKKKKPGNSNSNSYSNSRRRRRSAGYSDSEDEELMFNPRKLSLHSYFSKGTTLEPEKNFAYKYDNDEEEEELYDFIRLLI